MEALFNNDSLSERSRGVTIDSRISVDFTAALWKASDITVGWMPKLKYKNKHSLNVQIEDQRNLNRAVNLNFRNAPLANKLALASRKLPANTTTEVVPSPASMSWAFDNSTSC